MSQENLHTTPIGEAPAYPVVSFDVRLGKSVGYIDFDYDAYYAHMHANGVLDEEIAGSHIKVLPNSYMRPVRGSVNSETGELKVLASGRINSTFLHETQHLIDYHNGEIAEGQKQHVSRYRATFIAGMILFGESEVSDYVLHQPKSVSEVLSLASLAAVAVAGLAYYCSKPERRARYAAKTVDEQFFEVAKKKRR